jgi:hypothetical protein
MTAAKRNAPAIIVDDQPFDAPAGHVTYRRAAAGAIVGLMFGCPCGCGRAYGASFDRPNGWTFDGNVEKPTINPSLGCYPAGESKVGPDGTYHWHGYLRAGIFVEC